MPYTLLPPAEDAPSAREPGATRAEQALLDSETYFRTLLENARDVIHVINADGTTRYITPSVEGVLGWTAEELTGRGAMELVHPDDRQAALGQMRLARQTSTGRPLVFRAPHRDGSWRIIEATGRNLLDDPAVRGLIVNSRDITERVRAEEENLRLAAFPRESPNPILECAPDGRVLYTNPAGLRLAAELGVPGPEWILPPDHAERVARCGESAGAGVEVRVAGRVLAWTYHAQPRLGTVHLFGEEATERRRVQEQLVHDARHDALTGLPNRHFFLERLGEALLRFHAGEGGQFAVLFLDLDRFKVVNDSLGHHVGDELLVAVARRLRDGVRERDTVARFGGDEFAVLLQGLDAEGEAEAIAARIARAVAAPVNLSGYEVFTSASIGIALCSSGYERPEYLLRNADMAMYRAKAATGTPYEVFDRAMHAQALARLQMETDLRRALSRDEFRLRYQPIVSLATGKMAGVEALCRWEHPERGLIGPGEFIHRRGNGRHPPAGRVGAARGVPPLAELRAEFPHARIAASVNLSARQFAQKDLAGSVRAALAARGSSRAT
jgi:diguanylate cyclase (GGDEF)-like protein/PAS domain S-box-containing protein